jgi:hypothetical protein
MLKDATIDSTLVDESSPEFDVAQSVPSSPISPPSTVPRVAASMILAVGSGLVGVCGFFSKSSGRYAIASGLACIAAAAACVIAMTDFNFLTQPNFASKDFQPSVGIYLAGISATMFACSSVAFIMGRTCCRCNSSRNDTKQSGTGTDRTDFLMISRPLSSGSGLAAPLLSNRLTTSCAVAPATSTIQVTSAPVAVSAELESEPIELSTDADLRTGIGWWHGLLRSRHIQCFIWSAALWSGFSSVFFCLAAGAAQVGPQGPVCDFGDDLDGWFSWKYQFIVYVALLLYMIESCRSSSARYLSNMEETETVYEFVDKIRGNRPRIWWHVQCYHFETHTVTEYYTDEYGNRQSRTHTETKRVNTHSATGHYRVSVRLMRVHDLGALLRG